MSAFKIGDKVSVLHETIKGRVVEYANQVVLIEDEDGFLRKYPVHKIAFQSPEIEYVVTDEAKLKDAENKAKQILSANKISVNQTDQLEIDLHIECLRDRHNHLTNFEIIQIQMTTCRAFVQESIHRNRKKIVLIHGKGEGVLKSEIRAYLERLSNDKGVQLDYHDASFAEYGIGGATEVLFY